jgi:hypothetical protein
MAVDLAGNVSNQAGTAKVGLTVELWEKSAYEGSGSRTGSTTTDAQGNWAFTGQDITKLWLIVVVDGTKKVLPVHSEGSQQLTKLDVITDMNVDTINEHTAGAGVTIDGLLLKDGIAQGLDYGLSFKAIVTTATSTTVFAASGLTGKGNDFFTDYYAYVVWDAGGASAAPQGEIRPISDYVSSTGTFTHTAFSAQTATTDEILIVHKSIAFAFGAPIDSTPLAKGLYDILHKDGNFTFDNTTDSLEALSAALVTANVITTDWTNGGRLDLILDAINVIAADWTNAGRLDTILDAILVDTGTTLQGEIDGVQADTEDIQTKLAVVDGFMDVPSANNTSNAQMRDVIGNMTDTAVTGAPEADETIVAILKQLVNMQRRAVHEMTFFSEVDNLITLNASAADETFPPVTVADIPSGAVVVRAILGVIVGQFEDTSGSANSVVLAGTEHFQIDKTGGSYIDAIKLLAAQWLTGASSTRGGTVLVGDIDISAEVDGNDTYEIKMENADVTGASLLLRDVQTFIKVWYTLE